MLTLDQKNMIRNELLRQYKSVHEFAQVNNIANSQIMNALYNKGGGTIEAVERICKHLNIKSELRLFKKNNGERAEEVEITNGDMVETLNKIMLERYKTHYNFCFETNHNKTTVMLCFQKKARLPRSNTIKAICKKLDLELVFELTKIGG